MFSNIKLLFRKNLLHVIFIGVLLGCAIIFIITIHDYGASFDEPLIYEYARLTPSIYIKTIFNQNISSILDFGADFKYYGTSYLILGEVISTFLSKFTPLNNFDRWHIINFICFLAGAYGLFWLGKKFVSSYSAFIGGLLYLSQPLLWGHGVMNPKDTPFATFFILAIAAGIKMVDYQDSPEKKRSPQKAIISFFIKNIWGKILATISVFFIINLITSNFIYKKIISLIINHVIEFHKSSQLMGWLFSKARSIEVHPDLYLNKSISQINAIEVGFLLIIGLLIFLIFLRNSTTFQRWILLAGFILGFTISIRILGPAAGLLVILYWILTRKNRIDFFSIIFYLSVACISAYLLWPFLWANPILRFWESFTFMAHFPWTGSIRFEGKDWLAGALPWYYLPKMIGIQLTISSIILMVVGSILTLYKIFLRKFDSYYLLPMLWFYVPLFSWMVFKPTTYDNFRQFLFIIPPIFILSMIGFEKIYQIIKSSFFRRSFATLILIPGIIAIILLHPYEYIYYNAFVGWTSNIGRNYEADYWSTSFCAAGKYLEPLITNTTKIAFTNQVQMMLFQSCNHKNPILLEESQGVSQTDSDFSVITTRRDDDQKYFRWMVPVYTINIGNTPLLVIKQKK